MVRPAAFPALGLAASLLVALGGCESTGIEVSDPPPPRESLDGRTLSPYAPEPTLLGGGDLFNIFGGDDKRTGSGADLPVNRYLWRSTLDTLAFLPLSSTDPYGGVIVTDWGATAEAPNERFKVTAYITSAVLRPQSLRVVVNRQRKSSGQWVAADTSEDTARQLEDAILTRARQLKIADDEG